MMNLSPQTRRYLDAGVKTPANAAYGDLWPAILERNPERATGVALAILANLRAQIERELQESRGDMSRDRRIMLSNDLWFITDRIEELAQELQNESA